jgi:hypothetical protein
MIRSVPDKHSQTGRGDLDMKLATGALLLALASSTAWAQVNMGGQKPVCHSP